ncbi:hypothetical protein MAR_013269 [Mya arenaria]|uniref:Uncharacterized protein n=1 Tax=Mya arenaria TaxID=6604 RepID=A0ABY7FZD3_MYAAR|nr:hypothetical protein MAR_013269 [Mya arenaria]
MSFAKKDKTALCFSVRNGLFKHFCHTFWVIGTVCRSDKVLLKNDLRKPPFRIFLKLLRRYGSVAMASKKKVNIDVVSDII